MVYILLGLAVCVYGKSLVENNEKLHVKNEDVVSVGLGEEENIVQFTGGLRELVEDNTEDIDDETIMGILEEVADINNKKQSHEPEIRKIEKDMTYEGEINLEENESILTDQNDEELEDNIQYDEGDAIVEDEDEEDTSQENIYDVAGDDEDITIDTSDSDEDDEVKEGGAIKKTGDTTLKVEFRPVSVPEAFSNYDVDEDGLITLEELTNVTGARENVQQAFKDSDINGQCFL